MPSMLRPINPTIKRTIAPVAIHIMRTFCFSSSSCLVIDPSLHLAVYEQESLRMYALIDERCPSSLVCKQAAETNSSGCTACENLDWHWRPALRSSHNC